MAVIEGREIVEKAKALRLTVLRDMARRRQAARAQVERLRGGTRQAHIHLWVRLAHSIDQSMESAKLSLAEAKVQADAAARRVEDEVEPTDLALLSELDDAENVGMIPSSPTRQVRRHQTNQCPPQPKKLRPTSASEPPLDDGSDSEFHEGVTLLPSRRAAIRWRPPPSTPRWLASAGDRPGCGRYFRPSSFAERSASRRSRRPRHRTLPKLPSPGTSLHSVCEIPEMCSGRVRRLGRASPADPRSSPGSSCWSCWPGSCRCGAWPACGPTTCGSTPWATGMSGPRCWCTGWSCRSSSSSFSSCCCTPTWPSPTASRPMPVLRALKRICSATITMR